MRQLVLVFLFFTASLSASDYSLVLLTCARKLDCKNQKQFLRSLTKHPSDGSKNCDVGHAWLYLHGKTQTGCVSLEGGHSGELGQLQPTYLQGIMLLSQQGDPNPARYLWAVQKDGFFQQGCGKFRPTFAAKVALSREQFEEIVAFIQEYDFSRYSIVQRQCATFVAEVASIAGLPLEHRAELRLEPNLQCGSFHYRLWSDPKYSRLSFSSPDRLEESLRNAVAEGRAECVLSWYLRTRPKPKRNPLKELLLLPGRTVRHSMFR